jgi:hypothetical protein
MKVSDRKIDTKKREEGAWVTDIPEWHDLKLKVRGRDNKDWARMETEAHYGCAASTPAEWT